MKWTAAQLGDLHGRTAVVTGGNSGIGAEVARELAVHGARVVIACRDLARGDETARKIGSPAVEVVELDLASMKSVRTLAERWSGPLDLLINNAGVMAPPKRLYTEDGFELQFGTNHLGHFVLTGLLLPALLDAPAPRVVTVASMAHHRGTADLLDANNGQHYNPQRAYANSKLANLLFALELHRQARAHEQRLVSSVAHPGVAATGLVADREGMGANRMVRTFGPVFVRVLTQSAAAGARSVLYAATEAPSGSYTGPQRFGEVRGPIGRARMSGLAQDEKLARRLWQISEALTGFRYPWP